MADFHEHDDEYDFDLAIEDQDDDAYEDDYEVWCDYYSEELATLFHGLKDHASAMGLPMLEHANISEFCHFAFLHSSRRKPSI